MHLHYFLDVSFNDVLLRPNELSKTALVVQSTLTDRFQTTIPTAVRKALQLSKRDRIEFTIQGDGTVLLSRVEAEQDDPVLGEFLSFLAHDVQARPEQIQPLSKATKDRVDDLVSGVDVNLNDSLEQSLDDEEE